MTQAIQDHITSENKVALENEVALAQIANDICRRGFRVPALVVLESGPLLPFLGSQLLWVAQPALSLFIPSHKVRQAAEILETPEALSILSDYLREGDDTRDS